MLFTDEKCTHTHEVTGPDHTPFHLLAPGEKKNVPLLPDGQSWTHLSYFLSGSVLATVSSEWKPGLQRAGAVAFKTMAALYVEVEPVRWERGRPRLCNAVLMTGIHGQCQVQVGIWILVGGRGGFIRLLIQTRWSNPVQDSGFGSKEDLGGFRRTYCRGTPHSFK